MAFCACSFSNPSMMKLMPLMPTGAMLLTFRSSRFGITCTDQAACDAAGAGDGGPVLPPPPAVPALSLFGLLALALVLALGTALVLRRKA